MNWRNVDAEAWLLCTEWVTDVMNHTAEQSLGWRPPLQVLTGQTIDISIMLLFLYWDVGHALTFKILTDDTKKVICRSRLRIAAVGENNLKLDAFDGTDPERVFIRSAHSI